MIEKDPDKEVRNLADRGLSLDLAENLDWSTALKPRGRPKSADAKVLISLRLPPTTLARWKATGPGWQTRMAAALSRSKTV